MGWDCTFLSIYHHNLQLFKIETNNRLTYSIMASNNNSNGSKKRPGTIDYTKWENFEDSDDDDDDDGRGREDDYNDETRQRYYRRRRQEVSQEERQNEEQQQRAAAVFDTDRNAAAVVRLPDLKTLQDEWGIGKDATDGVNNHDDHDDTTQLVVRECSSCKHVGRSLKSCSRCNMVW